MRDTNDMTEDRAICEDTMMECSSDGGGLDDLVNLASNIADSAPSIQDAAERLLTLLGVDDDSEDVSSSEDEGVEVDLEDSEIEESMDTRLLNQLALSLAQELKYAKENTINSNKLMFDRKDNFVCGSSASDDSLFRSNNVDDNNRSKLNNPSSNVHQSMELSTTDSISELIDKSSPVFSQSPSSSSSSSQFQKLLQPQQQAAGYTIEYSNLNEETDNNYRENNHFKNSQSIHSTDETNTDNNRRINYHSQYNNRRDHCHRNHHRRNKMQPREYYNDTTKSSTRRMKNLQFGTDEDKNCSSRFDFVPINRIDFGGTTTLKNNQEGVGRAKVKEEEEEEEEKEEEEGEEDDYDNSTEMAPAYMHQESSTDSSYSSLLDHSHNTERVSEQLAERPRLTDPVSWGIGWDACATEALRYLLEDERLSPNHPTVIAMKNHLDLQRARVLSQFPTA